MTKDDDDELPPLEPIEETATAKTGKDNDDDKQTTISDTEIMEMHEKANELELQNVEEEVDDEHFFFFKAF